MVEARPQQPSAETIGATQKLVDLAALDFPNREGDHLLLLGVAGEASLSASHEASTRGLSPDPEAMSAARAFLQRLPDSYAVAEGRLFGSRARGDHRSGSDADVLVVLGGEPGQRYRVAGRMAEIAFDVMLETGILVDPLPLWQGELQRPEAFRNPILLAAIARDGVRI